MKLYQVPVNECTIYNPYKDMIMKNENMLDKNSYRIDFTKVKTVKDVIMLLKAMNMKITLPKEDDSWPEEFKTLSVKKMLIKVNDNE